MLFIVLPSAFRLAALIKNCPCKLGRSYCVQCFLLPKLSLTCLSRDGNTSPTGYASFKLEYKSNAFKESTGANSRHRTVPSLMTLDLGSGFNDPGLLSI